MEIRKEKKLISVSIVFFRPSSLKDQESKQKR